MRREYHQRRPNNCIGAIFEDLLNSRVRVVFRSGNAVVGVLFGYSSGPPYTLTIRGDDGRVIVCNLIAAEYVEEVR